MAQCSSDPLPLPARALGAKSPSCCAFVAWTLVLILVTLGTQEGRFWGQLFILFSPLSRGDLGQILTILFNPFLLPQGVLVLVLFNTLVTNTANFK